MNPTCRKFQESDLSALVELMTQVGYKHTEKSLAQNVDAVRHAGGEIFVAELSGLVCGCVTAVIDVRLATGSNGEIVSLVVKKSVRGKVIRKILVASAEDWLQNRTSCIRIRANASGDEAHLFYQSLGYSFSKTQTIFEKNFRPNLYSDMA